MQSHDDEQEATQLPRPLKRLKTSGGAQTTEAPEVGACQEGGGVESDDTLRARELLGAKRAVLATPVAVRKRSVKLNVGGVRFETSLMTLLSVENTYLSSLFDGRFAAEPLGDDGAVFVDRDGELFGYVLRFLRHPRRFEPKDLGDLSEAQQRALYVEADFYGLADVMLPSLTDPLQPSRDPKPESELKFNLSSEPGEQQGGQGDLGSRVREPPNKGKKTAPLGPSDCLKDVTVVISGVLDSLDIADAKTYIERHGGEVATSVSGRTSYLLVGANCDTSVYKNARAAGTPLMDEDGLFAIVSACKPTSLYPELDDIGRGLLQSALQLAKSGSDKYLGIRAMLNAIYACRRLLVCRTDWFWSSNNQSEDHPHRDEYHIRITNRTYAGWPVWEEIGGEIFHRTFSENNFHNRQEFVFGAKILHQGSWLDECEDGSINRSVTMETLDASQSIPLHASDDHENVRGGGHLARRWVDDDGERGEWQRFSHMGCLLVHFLPKDDALMVEAQRLIDKANQEDYDDNQPSDDEDEDEE